MELEARAGSCQRSLTASLAGCLQRVVEDGIPFKVGIYRLEGTDGWSLEVVTPDGTSIVWDDLFDDDAAAFDEAASTIRAEGALAFRTGGTNILPFRR
jgi:hypothetical protein